VLVVGPTGPTMNTGRMILKG